MLYDKYALSVREGFTCVSRERESNMKVSENKVKQRLCLEFRSDTMFHYVLRIGSLVRMQNTLFYMFNIFGFRA